MLQQSVISQRGTFTVSREVLFRRARLAGTLRVAFIFYIKCKVYYYTYVYIYIYQHTHYVQCAQAEKRVYTLHTYSAKTDTGDYGGLSPRGAIPRCSMTVTIVSALFVLENAWAIV